MASLGVLAAFVRAGLVSSNGEARRQIKGGGLKVNDTTVTDEKMVLTPATLTPEGVDQAFARQEAPRPAEADLDAQRMVGSAKARSWSGVSRNSKNLRSTPGAIAEIGLTMVRGLLVAPLTS